MKVMKKKSLGVTVFSVILEENNGRPSFLKVLEKDLMPLIHRPKANGFLMLVNEITKNIFDHAQGKGYVTFYILPKEIRFDIGDFGVKEYDLGIVRAEGSTKTHGARGQGICAGMIEDLAEGIGVHLLIDTKRGFRYTGVWVYG